MPHIGAFTAPLVSILVRAAKIPVLLAPLLLPLITLTSRPQFNRYLASQVIPYLTETWVLHHRSFQYGEKRSQVVKHAQRRGLFCPHMCLMQAFSAMEWSSQLQV